MSWYTLALAIPLAALIPSSWRSRLSPVGVLDEPKQLLPQSEELPDGGGPFNALLGLDDTLFDADGSAKIIKTLALLCGKIQRLQLEGSMSQALPSLASVSAVSALNGTKRGLHKQWPGLSNQIAGPGILARSDGLVPQTHRLSFDWRSRS